MTISCKGSQWLRYTQMLVSKNLLSLSHLTGSTSNGLETLLMLFKGTLQSEDAYQWTLHGRWFAAVFTLTGSFVVIWWFVTIQRTNSFSFDDRSSSDSSEGTTPWIHSLKVIPGQETKRAHMQYTLYYGYCCIVQSFDFLATLEIAPSFPNRFHCFNRIVELKQLL